MNSKGSSQKKYSKKYIIRHSSYLIIQDTLLDFGSSNKSFVCYLRTQKMGLEQSLASACILHLFESYQLYILKENLRSQSLRNIRKQQGVLSPILEECYFQLIFRIKLIQYKYQSYKPQTLFYFLILFFLLVSFSFYFIFYLWLGFQYDITVTITVITQSCNIQKVMEGSGTNNIMQYSNNILAL